MNDFPTWEMGPSEEYVNAALVADHFFAALLVYASVCISSSVMFVSLILCLCLPEISSQYEHGIASHPTE